MVLLAACSFDVLAQSSKETGLHQAQVVSGITAQSLIPIIQDMGFRCTPIAGADGKPTQYFEFKAEGHLIRGYVWSETTFILTATFTNDLKVTLTDLNKWNEVDALTTAFFDSDGDITISTAITVAGGVTLDHLEKLVVSFGESVPKFLGVLRTAGK